MMPPGRKQAQGTSSSDGMSGASDWSMEGKLRFYSGSLFGVFMRGVSYNVLWSWKSLKIYGVRQWTCMGEFNGLYPLQCSR